MKRFLIINPFGIGDVLFTTPLLRNIRDAFPGCFIGYWCNQRVEPLLKHNRCIDRVFALSRGDIKKIYGKSKLKGMAESLKLFCALKKAKFDISFDFSLDHRYTFITKLISVKERIGYDYKGRGRFLTKKIELSGYNQKHVIEYYLDLLKFIGIKASARTMELVLPEAQFRQAGKIISALRSGVGERIVGIAPGAGASWGKDAYLKHWPAGNYAELADRLSQELGLKVLVLADESEKMIADNLAAAMKSAPLNLAGKTSLEELIGIIADLDLLITNDGGPLHIAVALGRKTVSFFGPVDPLVYGPFPADLRKHRVLSVQRECSPCYRNFRLDPCVNQRQCLEGITTQMAFDAVKKLLFNE